MKKISIIGKGTAGILSANHFAYYTDPNEVEIECYFDSNIKEQTVGEGTTVDIPKMLSTTQGLEFNDIFKLVNGNFKTGIHYIGWGKQDFMHTFPMPNVSIHFNAVMLQDLLKERLSDRVKFIDENVNPLKLNTDHVIDCTGKPKDMSDMKVAEYIPVNSALVFQCSWDVPRYTHTICIAHKYGWIFGIPLQDRMSFGYLYNNKINNINEIKNELYSVIDEYGFSSIDKESHFEFNNYYRKQNYFKNYTYNGNASFFLEPMEATSIATVDEINRFLYDTIFNDLNYNIANSIYDEWFAKVQDVITIHYLAGSSYDTEFWKHAVKLAKLNWEKRSINFNILIDSVKNNKVIGNYGTWTTKSWEQNLTSLGFL